VCYSCSQCYHYWWYSNYGVVSKTLLVWILVMTVNWLKK